MKVLLSLLMFLSIWPCYGQEVDKNFEQGQEFFGNKDYEKALKSFKKAFKKSPTVHIKFWIAHTYAEMENISEAKPLFLEIVKSNHQGSERAMSLQNLANCYAILKQSDSAHFYYDLGIAEFPSMASTYFNKGQLLYSESLFSSAKEQFDKAIEIESGDWLYYQKRLEVCFATQNYECALNDLKKVKQLNPEMKLEFNLAYCYSMLKKYEQADSVFQLIYDDQNPAFLNNYGLNKHNLGNSDEGKKLIMQSLELAPNNSFAYRNLALISIDKKEFKKACQHLNKALSLGFKKQYGGEVSDLIIEYCN